jgi:antitoxin ParD1/3/4
LVPDGVLCCGPAYVDLDHTGTAGLARGEFASIDEAARQLIDERITERMIEEDYLAWAKPLVDEARAGIARGEAMSLTERKARMNALLEIYGGFRSEEGAKDFAVTRSVLSTARKQGWDILATLIGDPDRLLTQLSVG